jgi:hypothetical protein
MKEQAKILIINPRGVIVKEIIVHSETKERAFAGAHIALSRPFVVSMVNKGYDAVVTA